MLTSIGKSLSEISGGTSHLRFFKAGSISTGKSEKTIDLLTAE
jgi:hypothetical protein